MADILQGTGTLYYYKNSEMSGKEKNDEHRHDHAGKKKNMSRQVEKNEHEPEVQQNDNLPEELKAFEQKAVEMQEQIKVLEEKSQSLQDKYLRLSAEFDNYRKRTLKEKTDLIKNASEDLLIHFLPFMDDIERGLEATNISQDVEAVREGMSLIYSKFRDFLSQNGVKEIDAKDQEFNADLHEAVTKVPAPTDDMKGKVVDVIKKGYMLHDKVIRYPKVVVGE